nr:PREDICTED: putative zinc metalloproteinase YIL108W [Bemisia tabaci]
MVRRDYEIKFFNYAPGNVVNHSLILIKGFIVCNSNIDGEDEPSTDDVNGNVEDAIPDTIEVSVGEADTSSSKWDVVNLKYKCLVNLSFGKNVLTFRFAETITTLVLSYVPRDTLFRVTPVYIICDEDDGRFQSPEGCDNSIESACNRINLGCKLIQCLVSNKLFEKGFGHKTFQLESDFTHNSTNCLVFYSKLPVCSARTMKPEDLWEYFGREIMTSIHGNQDCKFLAFLSCTIWDGTTVKAHAALGGGGLALFGSACLHTWPDSFDKIIPCFLNSTKINKSLLMDDSCHRGTYGGCFSTTLGAVCHELGHTFDLGHTKHGLMGRGFDHIDLVFTMKCTKSTERCSKNVRNINKIGSTHHAVVTFIQDINVSCNINSLQKPRNPTLSQTPITSLNRNSHALQDDQNSDDKTFWSASCATILAFHKWFNNFDRNLNQEDVILKFDRTRNAVISNRGIKVIELRKENGDVLHSWQFPENLAKKKLFLVPVQHLNVAETIVVEDAFGNLLKQRLSSLV